MARVSNRGKAVRCERKRNSGSEFCVQHNKFMRKYGQLPYGRHDEEYSGIHPIDIPGSEEKNNAEKASALLGHDAVIAAKKLAEKQRDMNSEESLLIDCARKYLDNRDKRGKLQKHKVTTETMSKIINPTFGINLAEQGKTEWLKETTQALMALPKEPLSILAAAVGPFLDANKASDCCNALRVLIRKSGGEKLHIRKRIDLVELLLHGVDPVPQEIKYLRIRYCLQGIIGELCLVLDSNFSLEEDLVLQKGINTNSRLTIVASEYGHPHDLMRRFDVKEKIQGMVDMLGDGKFVKINSGIDLSQLFGEPCEGVNKVLKVKYIIDALYARIEATEARGWLLEPIHLLAPSVTPSVTITFATFSPKSSVGRKVTEKGNAKSRLLNYQHYDNKRRAAKTSIRCLDDATIIVTGAIRKLVDNRGGDMLVLESGQDVSSILRKELKKDPTFYHKYRGNTEMLLHIEYRANNKLCEAKLTTDKDFILENGVYSDNRPVEATIEIDAAVYGHPTDTSMQFNVQEILSTLVKNSGGLRLDIDTQVDLNELFEGDPCYPFQVNKVLQISYHFKKLSGQTFATINPDGKMAQSIKIGWPLAKDGWKKH